MRWLFRWTVGVLFEPLGRLTPLAWFVVAVWSFALLVLASALVWRAFGY